MTNQLLPRQAHETEEVAVEPKSRQRKPSKTSNKTSSASQAAGQADGETKKTTAEQPMQPMATKSSRKPQKSKQWLIQDMIRDVWIARKPKCISKMPCIMPESIATAHNNNVLQTSLRLPPEPKVWFGPGLRPSSLPSTNIQTNDAGNSDKGFCHPLLDALGNDSVTFPAIAQDGNFRPYDKGHCEQEVHRALRWNRMNKTRLLQLCFTESLAAEGDPVEKNWERMRAEVEGLEFWLDKAPRNGVALGRKGEAMSNGILWVVILVGSEVELADASRCSARDSKILVDPCHGLRRGDEKRESLRT
ncbi:hypothetical protein C8J56DRAFT_1139849 [Mycena floridula]|nr:hypothetical protein C8J56DRAFT_1139849 [Mycena floridula]